jgi:hypothetical protein
VQLYQPAHISTTAAGLAKIAVLLAHPKLAEGLCINHPHGHLHQYTWLKETQSSTMSKSMTRMKKLRKMKQQKRRNWPESSKKLRGFGRNRNPP